MTDFKISQFPAANSADASDVLAGVQSGTTKKFSLAVILAWIKSQLRLTAKDVGAAADSSIATVEASTTASKNYAVKDYLIMSGVLYRVTSPISSGATITIGTNVTPAVLGNDVAAQVTQIGTNQTAISAIEGKIPSAASPLNQLADKDFVTDSITQGTAIFRGSFATRAALLAVQWQTTNPGGANYVSNNDYAVVLDDESQNDECWRYIYVTGTGWTPQYRINESPLTQAQLDAINSGATAAIISSVGDKLDKTGDGSNVTATFTAASTRANISTGEKLSVMFGKIAKWFADLGTAAFAAISTSTPNMDGTGAAGSTGEVADAGHVHPTDTTRAPAGYGLGIMMRDVGTSITDCNDVTVTGWFDVSPTASNRPASVGNYNTCLYSVVRGPQFAYQELYYYANQNQRVFCRFRDTIYTPQWTDWEEIAYRNKALATAQQIANPESRTTASRAYAVGEYFCQNGLLYRAKTAISSGATFTVGTNCESTTVGDEIQKKAIFSTTSSSPAVLSFGANARAIIFASATNTNGMGLYAVASASTNTTSVKALTSGSAITMTSSGSTITVSSSTNVVYEILMLAGNLPTIS